ncbi:cytochrome c [Agrobacterium tumefaciens]|nr:cytochrome c [Agrobacterium tumefaciens]NTE21363.1 cytochrome c [Agrobacterium tumefaciens]
MNITVSNTTKLILGSALFLFTAACVNKPSSNQNMLGKENIVATCKYYRYEAGQIISNLGCKNCHLRMTVDKKDEYGSPTFIGLASMDSLKIIEYAFTKKHKGWYSKTGSFKTARMDTLSDCEIRNVIRYIKDAARNIPMPSQ